MNDSNEVDKEYTFTFGEKVTADIMYYKGGNGMFKKATVKALFGQYNWVWSYATVHIDYQVNFAKEHFNVNLHDRYPHIKIFIDPNFEDYWGVDAIAGFNVRKGWDDE